MDCVPHIGEYATKTNAVWATRVAPVPNITQWAQALLRQFFACKMRRYCPWVFNTWSQAALILVRFSFRQARMVKSPWSITARQCF